MDSTWSKPGIFCQRRSCGNPGEIENGEMQADDFLFGSRVNYTCKTGYNMVSRYNYRDCQADGIWSNAPPICEIQICKPPDAITDGSFEPVKDEYTYQDAVTYKCDKKLTLIGESTISCMEKGVWSHNAPKCKAVECKNPEVANAIKLSGFIGPYLYQYAVTFECSPGFKMNGTNVVKCNENSEWDPPLPTCYSSTVTIKPVTNEEKPTEPKGKVQYRNSVGCISKE
ncbi:membrane cofactor protein-like [Gastrophryne carolinensis]